MKIFLLVLPLLFLFSCTFTEKSSIIENNNKKIKVENESIDNIKSNSEVELDKNLWKLKFDKVLPILEENYIKNPSSVYDVLKYTNALLMKGSLYYEENISSLKAIEILTITINENPNSTELWRMLWYSYEIIELYDQAIVCYETSINKDENNFMTYNNLWHTYKLLWNDELAKQYFEKSLEKNEDFDHAILNMWNMYLQKKDFINAKINYLKVLDKSNNDHFKSEAAYTLWNIELWEWNSDKAKDLFKKSINFNEHFELGYIWLSKINFNEFLETFNIDEGKANLWLYNESINNLLKALNINPNRTLIYYNLGIQYNILWNIEESKIMFNKWLEVLSNDISLSLTEKNNFKELLELQLVK